MTTLQVPSPNSLRKFLMGMFGPTLLLVIALFGFGFLGSYLDGAAAGIVNLIFGLTGLVGVVAMIAGPIWGVIQLGKWEEQNVMQIDENSGKGEASVVPEEIKQWNWGAAGLTWIWGVYFHTWLSLLVFIPFVNIVMFIVLGVKGNEWAWKESKWESPQKFLEFQNKWKGWGIFFFIFQILGLIMNVFVLGMQILFEAQMQEFLMQFQ